jgi:UDP-N-acetylglucosamine 2-epimerase (non-hydrolysing)
MKLLHVVGARPNFPKLAPVFRAAQANGIPQTVVHTGQHYDDALFGAFLRDLEMPPPDLDLGVGSASHAVQTARIMERLEAVLDGARPDWILVYGDVNSTMAAAIVGAKLGLRTAHVEAGLRSGDRSMPEEINRIVTDRLADLLLTPSRDADERLRAEGEPPEEIAFVGNVMIDSLLHGLRRLDEGGRTAAPEREPVVVTLHRPSNVDDPERLAALIACLGEVARDHPVVFPVHPRTQRRIEASGLSTSSFTLCPPFGYLEMLALVRGARAVITDSGGLQEETTVLGIPCLTVRDTTERPITITLGTNRLVPDPRDIPAAVRRLPIHRTPRALEGWDGCAGERVIQVLTERA